MRMLCELCACCELQRTTMNNLDKTVLKLGFSLCVAQHRRQIGFQYAINEFKSLTRKQGQFDACIITSPLY